MTITLNGADPAEALKLFEELATSNEESPYDSTPAEPVAQPAEAQTAAEPSETVDEVTEVQEQEAAGVATKDGKHVIPYSVLKSERERATAAERQLQEVQTRLAALEAQAKQPQTSVNTGATDTTEAPGEADMSEAELALLEEDFPTVAKAIRSAMAKASALEAKFRPVENAVREEAQSREQTRAMSVQDTIDSIPKLAHIQATDPDAFNAAQQFDAVLMKSPAWADKPLSERFAKVIDMVEAMHGEISVPGQKPQAAAAKDPAQLREEAAKKVAQTAKPAVPTSLSQFPAGEPVATDDSAALETMSHADIAGKLARMTPEQQMHFLSNL